MKIVTVIGARPQFIKASAVSRAIRENNLMDRSKINEVIIHTGQHYDKNMSEVFFSELEIPEPTYNLGVNSASHGAMTGQMLEKLEVLMIKEKPDLVLIYGDTNSTLAGTLAAVKLNIPLAHVEAGLRSFNMTMPEEVNRIVADRLSSILFCPTETAVNNLLKEGITDQVYNVGDVMYDVSLFFADKALAQYSLSEWGVHDGEYVLCTIHRAENTDVPERLKSILTSLQDIADEVAVIFPMHPRTYKLIREYDMVSMLHNIKVIEPVSYLEMVRLEKSAKAILTDSGGVQKEAFFHRVPCLTLREETEWVETMELGGNELCGADKNRILDAWHSLTHHSIKQDVCPYGNGNSAEKIVALLVDKSICRQK